MNKIEHWIAHIGDKYSAEIYIIHPSIITFCSLTAIEFGIEEYCNSIATIIVFFGSIISVSLFHKVKRVRGRKYE